MSKSEEILSYGELLSLYNREKNELEPTRKMLGEAKDTLSEVQKAWKDASQANFLLSSKLSEIEESDSRNEQILHEKDRQIRVWREAYESVIHSRTWKIASKFKRVFKK